MDVYNILQHNVPGDNSGSSGSTSHKILAKLRSDSLSDLMNGPIRQKLKIIPKNVKWGGAGISVAYSRGMIIVISFTF